MRSIAFVNHKGGVGKTTTTLNLGAALHQLNKKVLLIDIDPQAHLTYSIGIQAHELGKTIYDLLKGDCSYKEVITAIDGIDVIPASLDLSGADLEFGSIPGREFLLKEALHNVNGYDYILIDCPPSLGLLTLNALTSVNEIFVPLQAEYLSLQGMSRLLQAVEVVKKRLNSELDITGIIGTRVDVRKKLNKEVVDRVKEHFHDKLFRTLIRDNISLAEAPSFGQHIFNYKRDSHGAEDYLQLAKEVLNITDNMTGGNYEQ